MLANIYLFLLLTCLSCISRATSFISPQSSTFREQLAAIEPASPEEKPSFIEMARECIRQKLETTSTRPHVISVAYELHDEELLSEATEIRYREYHKRPVYDKTVYSREKIKPTEIVTFVYRDSDKKHLAKICTNPQQSFREVTHIKLAQKFVT